MIAASAVTRIVAHTDWQGLAAFVTSCATLIGALGAYAKSRQTERKLDLQVAPKVDEMHDRVVNGSSKLPADTPRSAPDRYPEQTS